LIGRLPPQAKLRMHTTRSWQMLSGSQSMPPPQVTGRQYGPVWQMLGVKPGAHSAGGGGATSARATSTGAMTAAAVARNWALRMLILPEQA
jgi:hypothetical protein